MEEQNKRVLLKLLSAGLVGTRGHHPSVGAVPEQSQNRSDLSLPVEVCECIPLFSFSAPLVPFPKRFSPPSVLGGSLGSSLLKVDVWSFKLSIVLIPFPFLLVCMSTEF